MFGVLGEGREREREFTLPGDHQYNKILRGFRDAVALDHRDVSVIIRNGVQHDTRVFALYYLHPNRKKLS